MKFYSVKDVADMLDLNIDTIKRYIYRKEITAYKVGKEWRIQEEDLEKFIYKESNKEGNVK